jgi:hypothetical protein
MVVNAQSVIHFLKSCPSPVHDLQDDLFERNVASGRCKLHVIGRDGDTALMAYEIQGKEFVVIALKGIETKKHIDLFECACREADKLGRAAGCSYIRFHTFRHGLVKKALREHFLPAEFILRKPIP